MKKTTTRKKAGFVKDEKGAIMVTVAILISVLLAFTAIVIDAGICYHDKNKLQTASDSVTLAVATSVSKTEDYNPVKNATQAVSVKKEVQKMYEENGIDDFKYVSGDLDATNIQIYSIDRKDEILEQLKDKDDDIVCIFYKAVDATDTESGYRYIEIYAHSQTSSIFGNMFDIEFYNMSVSSAAKCDVVKSGNPEALNYQIINLNPDENFDITGPLEDTGLKTLLDITENLTNTGLDFLQNKTYLISKYIMGGKTAFTCPNCGTTQREIYFEATDASGNIYYVCPNCGTECTLDDSNKVGVNITTSAAVVNGYIHSNGGANISIDTFRLRSFLDETEPIDSEIVKEDDYFTYYANGIKTSSRPILELSKGEEYLTIDGNNTNDIYFLGDPITKVNESGEPVSLYRTIYKAANSAKPWDASRVRKQFIYNADIIEDPGFFSYVSRRYTDLSKTGGNVNVGSVTKTTSGQSYNVDFEGECENGITWRFDASSGTLTIGGASAIADYGSSTNVAPWLSNYRNEIKAVVIQEGISEIGSYAFYNCKNLTSVSLPSTLTSISYGAFVSCPISEITIPNSTTFINSTAFSISTLKKIYGGKNSYAQQWASQNGIEFSTQVDTEDSNAPSVSKYDVVANAKSILEKIDLGNDKALPDVYDVYDSYYNFDFDNDNRKDSLEEVISGETTVTDIVKDKKNHISSSTGRDDIRIQLDSIITSITGEVHSESNVTSTHSFEDEFDINVQKAVDTEDTLIKSELSNLERQYFESTTLDSGVSNTVSKYNTLLEQQILEKLNINSVTPENYMKMQAQTYASTSEFESDTVNLYNSIVNRDSNVSSRVISEKTSGFASVSKKNIDGLSYDDDNGSVSYKDGNGWYRTFNCADGSKVKYDTQNFEDDECGLVVSKTTDAYVDGYVHTGKKSSWFVTTYTNVVLNNGTETDPTILYIGGSSKKTVNGVNAALDISGSLILYPHSRLVVHGDIYIGNGNIHMWQDTSIICDGNIYVNGSNGNGIIAAATADSSRIFCSGNVVINADSEQKTNGIGTNGLILCGGNLTSPKADFYSNGTILTQTGFTSGKLNNTGNIFSETGDIYSTGFITSSESGILYAKNGNIISDKDSVTNSGVIYAGGYLDAKSGNLSNNGRIYVGSYVNCASLNNQSASAVIYAGGNVNINADSTIYGWLCSGKMINAQSNNLYVYGIVSALGSAMDANSNEASDPVLASYIQGITAGCVDVYNDAQLYIRGRVTCNENGFAFIKTEDYLPASVKGFAMIDGGMATDGGYALSTKTYLKLINGSRLFVNGNANIDEKDGISVYIDANTYLNVSGTLVLKQTLPVVQGCLIHVGNLIVPTTMSCGVSEMTVEGSKQTGLMVDGDMTVTGDFSLYGLTYVGASLTVSGRITVDDNSETFVGSHVNANDLYLWDYGNLFIGGNLTLNSTADRTLYFAEDNSTNMLLCAGDVTSGKNIEIYDEGILMSGGKTTAQSGFFYVYSGALTYSKGNYVFNYADSTVENIMFTDSDIESLYSSTSTLRVTSEDLLYYDNLINITIKVEILQPNTSTQIRNDISYLPLDYGTLSLGESGQQVVINKGVTIFVQNADIYFTGDVINYGTIICYSGNLFKKGGNIYFTDGNEYTSFTNYGTVYCEGDFDVRGTNNGKTVGIWYHNGISLQNGNKSNQSPEMYIGGNLKCQAAVDNFGKIFVAGDVETTTKYNAKTYSSGQQSTGVGFDNENNSVFMNDGTVNTNNGNDERTSITVRSNSVFYCASNVRTSRNFIVGNAFLQGGTTSQDGAQQYAYMASDAYKGLDNSVAGYQLCTAITPGAVKVVNADSSSVGNGEISASEIAGMVYDQYGNKINDMTTVYDKYVVYSFTANGHGGSMVYDFGFAYIDGTLTTGTGNANYVQPYGKSVIYVAGNSAHSSDNYYNQSYAIETHHIFTFPFSRIYCGGNLKTYGGNSDNIALNEWFYTFMYIDGSAEFAGKVKMRDATTTIVNGPITAGSYVEIGKAPDGDDEAIDGNNFAFVQCDGDFRAGGYIKIYARATLNANGNISNGLNYITLRHHAAMRAGGDITCSQADIGSGSVVYSGGDFTALTSTMKIRDNCEISVGGKNGGNLSALSYIEIGKHEDEQYKYNNWSTNRQKNDSSLDYEVPDDGGSGAGTEDTPTGDDSVNNDIITCPECGEQGTIASGKFSSTVTDGIRYYTCARCSAVFDDTADAFEDDDAIGASVYVNGTINSVTSYLKLFANTQAYATKSIRSFRYITLRHHAGLYVTTESPSAQGIMYDYDADSRLLDSSGNAVEGFFVDTDTSSSEYGNIFYYPAQVIKEDGSTVTERLYGFTVEADYSESFTPDETKGTLYQNILYYYEDGEKVYYTKSTDVEVNGEIQQSVDYYGFENGVLVLGAGDSLVGTQVNSREISLVVTEGSVISYGPLSVNTYANIYATGDIFSAGKTYIGNGAVVYAEGDYMCTKIISISSLIDGNSVCGFEMKHGALRTGGDIRIFSCSEIEGGTIDAIGDITFDSIYTNYDYDGSNVYTDEKDIDLFMCSRNGDINFNCLYSSTGGVTYAPNGTISADGVYFEHNGSFIAGDNNINCFYINLHRLDNLATLDLEWVSPDQVYLCEVEDAD